MGNRKSRAAIKWMFAAASVVVAATALPCVAGAATGAAGQSPEPPPDCGTMYAPPFGDEAPRRACEAPARRTYTPVHRGLGFDILNLESQACFVPDSSYQLLDEIVGRVSEQLKRGGRRISKKDRALAISQATGDVMATLRFGLYIPTESLGDALVSRNPPGQEPRYIFDCDTGSIILLTIADQLNVSASLVEITLPSGSQHNYVRWPVGEKRSIDWDVNGRGACMPPKKLPIFQGKAMSRRETMGYAHTLRALLWTKQKQHARALADYRFDMRYRPDHPSAFNEFAWLVASADFVERNSYMDQALRAAKHAVSMMRHAGSPEIVRKELGNYLDTLACVYAHMGDYLTATKWETEAKDLSNDPEFIKRLASFTGPAPSDCTAAADSPAPP